MKEKLYISKWRIHFLFGGGFLAAVASSVVTEVIAGKSFSDAAWSAARGVRPTEVVMFISFWYAFAFHQPTDEWSSSFTTLNLQDYRRKNN